MNARLQHYVFVILFFPISFFYTCVFLGEIENSINELVPIVVSSIFGFLLSGIYAELFAAKIKSFYWLITLFIGFSILIAIYVSGLNELYLVDSSSLNLAFVLMGITYKDEVLAKLEVHNKL